MGTPSIGDLKRKGAIGVIAICMRPACGHKERVPFERLGLRDDAVFSGPTTAGRFICQKCGKPNVQLAPDWPDALPIG